MVKPFLPFLLFFATQWAYCQPAPSNVILPLTLSASDRAQLNALVNDILAKDTALKAELNDIRSEEQTAEVNLAAVQMKLDRDEETIAKQSAQLAKWKTFGRAMLLAVFGIAFGGAWRLSGFVVNLWIRLAVCLGVALAASGLVWRIITQLL